MMILLMAGLALVAPEPGFGQTSFEARPESKIVIKGSSTVHDFDCLSDEIRGQAEIATEEEEEIPDTVEANSRLDVRILFPVKKFDCGRSRMNRDFYETLEAEEHEEITFDFISAKQVDNPSEEYDLYEVSGILTVAGREREIKVEIKGFNEENDVIRIEGYHPISMKDFGIDPPTALMGMIQVDDELEVHFDLYVQALQ